MNKKVALSIASSALLFLPAIGLAQVFPQMPSLNIGTDLYGVIVGIATIVLNATWIIAVAFVIVMFVISGFKFITAQGDMSKVAEARQAVIWGAGGVIVILLAFSILVAMRATIGV